LGFVNDISGFINRARSRRVLVDLYNVCGLLTDSVFEFFGLDSLLCNAIEWAGISDKS